MALEKLGELAGIDWGAVLLTALWAGLVAFTLGVSFMLWTRWGYYHVTGKCVLFSLLAHLLLALFFCTSKVMDNAVVAFANADRSARALSFEDVRIMSETFDPIRESSTDGRSDDAGAASMWDRPGQDVEIDSAAIDRAPPAVPDAAPAERPTRDTAALPRQSPRPELPVRTATPEPPKLATSDPEAPGRVEQLASPADETARSESDRREALPGDAPSRVARAPVPRDADVVRGNAGVSGEIESPRESAGRVPPSVSPAGTAAAPSVPARPIISAVRPGTATGADDAPAGASQPIATPESATSGTTSDRPGPSGSSKNAGSAGGASLLPSADVRPGFAGGARGSGESSVPARSARSGEASVPLPGVKSGSFGIGSAPATGSPGPLSTARPFVPGKWSGGGSSGGAGLRLGTPEIYRDRTNPNRSETAVLRGGSTASEEAVARALAWLAAHQHPDGHWDGDGFQSRCLAGDTCSGPASQIRDDCAMTGLVLLAFFGAGHTHQSGNYQVQVVTGLNWLLEQQKPSGDLRGTGRMYSQGIASLALSEAYGMTGDSRLREPVERAVKFIVGAQNPTSGGWRYLPGQYGDTSIFGWQLMALKSASLAGVHVPDSTWQKARIWLTTVGSGRHRGLASYLPSEQPMPAMTAEALVCRLFMGATADDAAVREAADYLMDYLPQPTRQNLYYWYYGTVACFQVGGDHWQRWNTSLRDQLIAKQARAGHAAGSWDPASDPWGLEGGRVFTTALATLSLEVYYRFLPLQSLSSTEPRAKADAASRDKTPAPTQRSDRP